MKIKTFSLPAGRSCKFAKDCRAHVEKKAGGGFGIVDGKHMKFRCFAASNELYPNVYKAHDDNYTLLKNCNRSVIKMANLLDASYSGNGPLVFGKGNAKLQKTMDKKVCRVHVSGDFFSQEYFDAWLRIAVNHPNDLFYAYTKALGYWINRKYDVPSNFVLTASRGGTKDALIEQENLREARVVFSEEEARNLNLEIDHDDSHAMAPGGSFALLIHGVQPSKSPAAEALKLLGGKSSYSYKKKVS